MIEPVSNVTPLRPRTKRPPKPEGSLIRSLHEAHNNFSASRKWAIEGLLEGNQIALLVGKEKSGKSWLAQDLAVSTVCGGRFLGRFPVVRQGPVLYIDSEYGDDETYRRITRLARGHGCEAAALMDDFDYMYGQGLTIAFFPGSKAETNTVKLAREIRDAREAGDPGPSLIVIDPLRNFLGGNENDAEVVTEFFCGLDMLRTSAQCPIVVVHHLNKSGSYAGSRALLARADLIIEGTDDDEPWYSAIGRTIRRKDPLAERFTIAIDHVDDEDDAKAKTILRARFANENRNKAEVSRPALRVLDLVKETHPISQNQIKNRLGKTSGTTVKKYLHELETAGLVQQGKDGWEPSLDEACRA